MAQHRLYPYWKDGPAGNQQFAVTPLEERLTDKATGWKTVKTAQWYNEDQKEVEVVRNTAVWYPTGRKLVSIRWVLIRNKAGKKEPVALLCTNAEPGVEVIIDYFARRWLIEVTFEKRRAHLGIET